MVVLEAIGYANPEGRRVLIEAYCQWLTSCPPEEVNAVIKLGTRQACAVFAKDNVSYVIHELFEVLILG